jgi:hypothetical protein
MRARSRYDCRFTIIGSPASARAPSQRKRKARRPAAQNDHVLSNPPQSTINSVVLAPPFGMEMKPVREGFDNARYRCCSVTGSPRRLPQSGRIELLRADLSELIHILGHALSRI